MKMPLSPEERAKLNRSVERGLLLKISAALVLATAVGAYGLWAHERKLAAASPALATTDAASVVATVDGHAITELQISGIEAAGVDRAIALDRTINKVLLEQLARKLYPQESALALEDSAR
ncbi:MAG TPA: hypothetical protein VH328_14750, partial [Burkholderiaceae bacterium]|nr:hypothetical protein [Burkholderiaceae bacterium]